MKSQSSLTTEVIQTWSLRLDLVRILFQWVTILSYYRGYSDSAWRRKNCRHEQKVTILSYYRGYSDLQTDPELTQALLTESQSSLTTEVIQTDILALYSKAIISQVTILSYYRGYSDIPEDRLQEHIASGSQSSLTTEVIQTLTAGGIEFSPQAKSQSSLTTEVIQTES